MRIRTVLTGLAMTAGMMLAGAGPAAAVAGPSAAADGIGTYRITFATGDLDNADTDDAVRVTFVGTTGSVDKRIERDFRRGEVYTYGPFTSPNAGTISQVYVTKSNEERDAWYLNYVQLHEQGTGWLFHCEADVWFPQTGPKRLFSCVKA
ncbi:PLAT/LH2 domain-containing protein [Jidongwangia harbinensis]|uniref:PLAT/LH2 domain-containing protein n=1 Tax=Jidongwangia harbinensis TaxID=2878561 RepID=UPI001CD97AC6|nr:PLAT/LH2 domain-containing protein [Jidongwangia harbinensis]MCA2213973.1 hypothetical protein [Jidongwangia harbinensis]